MATFSSACRRTRVLCVVVCTQWMCAPSPSSTECDPDSLEARLFECEVASAGTPTQSSSSPSSISNTQTNTDSYVETDTDTDTDTDAHPGEDAVLIITGPAESEVVGTDLEVTFEVIGCDINSPSNDTQACHLHTYLNGEPITEEQGNYGHYTNSPISLVHLDAGEHHYELWLIPNDGPGGFTDEPFDPPIIDAVTFTVFNEDTGDIDTGTY